MSEDTLALWVARALVWIAGGIAAYRSGLWTFEPSWNPDWKLWLVFTAVFLLASTGAHLRGSIKARQAILEQKQN